MSTDATAETYKQLDAVWSDDATPTAPIAGQNYVIISDLHLGNGGPADNFKHNCDTFQVAMRHYLELQFNLILAGDTEELWQFRLDEITKTYEDTVYRCLKEFASANRLTRIFGNHDREWGSMPDPAFYVPRRYGCPEAMKLADAEHKPRILIVHGHQGTPDSDKDSWFSRFVVHLYRYIEPVTRFLSDDPAATRSDISRDYERMMYGWAKERRALLICGHSHRAVAASLSYTETLRQQKADLEKEKLNTTTPAAQASVSRQVTRIDATIAHERKRGRNFIPVEESGTPVPCYFNTGCCCYKDGLTAIEIDADRIALVKWSPQREIFQSMPLGSCLTSI